MTQRTFGRALGELIYQKRMAAGLSQIQLSEDAFGSAAKTRRISELETGSVANPHMKTIDPIIVTLGITEAEVEACARQAMRPVDSDLDRALREARNLLDALALQFDLAQPDASLSQLEDFLRTKAKEWRALRDRIHEIDADDHSLSEVLEQANIALGEGRFNQVDVLLAEAEAKHQDLHTLKAIRTQAIIRISRGDNALLSNDQTGALTFYRSAVRFFAPFDETEMVETAQALAARIYERSRRSLEPAFAIASTLLEDVWPTQAVQTDPSLRASIAYRLGLILRNHALAENGAADLRNRAIAYSRAAVDSEAAVEDRFGAVSMKIGLANCLLDKAKAEKDADSMNESIALLRSTRSNLEEVGDCTKLLAHVCNSLGSALLSSIWALPAAEALPSDRSAEALAAFQQALVASEAVSDVETWGAAKANIGGLLAERSKQADLQPFESAFLQVRAIAEFCGALETYPATAFPFKFAEIHIQLGRVLVDHASRGGEGLVDFYLMRSLQSFEAATAVYEEKTHPKRWAELQSYIGAVILYHARLEGSETQEHDYPKALEHFREAHRVALDTADTALAAYCEKTVSQIETEMAST